MKLFLKYTSAVSLLMLSLYYVLAPIGESFNPSRLNNEAQQSKASHKMNAMTVDRSRAHTTEKYFLPHTFSDTAKPVETATAINTGIRNNPFTATALPTVTSHASQSEQSEQSEQLSYTSNIKNELVITQSENKEDINNDFTSSPFSAFFRAAFQQETPASSMADNNPEEQVSDSGSSSLVS
ncbi:MAG: hypothetical protein R3240_03940, partial [Gammaproteobacteria bacterium]|nr:hypothetical protein [Gammaproteobacteria bacterium]